MMSDEIQEPVTDTEGVPAYAYAFSLAVAWATGAVPHRCYANAWAAITQLPALADAFLVEGWMVLEQPSRISLIEHAWCLSAQSGIVDPSIVLLAVCSQPVWYFPGMQHDQAALRMLTCDDLPFVRSVGRYGEDGMGHPGYQRAYQQAYEHALGLVSAATPYKALVREPSLATATSTHPAPLRVKVVSSTTFLRGA